MKKGDMGQKLIVLAVTMFAVFALAFYELIPAVTILVAVAVVVWWDWRAICVAIVPAAIYTAVYLRQSYDILMLCGFVLCGIALGAMLRRKLPNRIVAVVTAAATSIISTALFVIAAKNANVSITDAISDTLGLSYYASMLKPKIFAAACMTTVVVMGICIGGVIFLFARFLLTLVAKLQKLKGQRTFEIRNMVPVPFWALSKNFTIAMCVGLGGVLIANLTNNNNATTITYVILAILAVPLCVQGTSFTLFIIKLWQVRGKGNGMLLLFVYLIAFPTGAIITGLAEQFLRIRSRVRIVRIKYNDADNTSDADGMDNIAESASDADEMNSDDKDGSCDAQVESENDENDENGNGGNDRS